MRRAFGRRLADLEAFRGGAVDLAAEADRYGAPLWTAADSRAYARQDGADFRLTVCGPGAPLENVVVGVDGSQV